MNKRYIKITLLLLTAFFCLQEAMAKVWYVNSPTVSWQGKNSANVLNSLSELKQADGDEVWLAAGTFSLDETFTVSKKISIYGGFAGTESKIEDRKKVEGGKPWEFVNETILDGRGEKRVINITSANVFIDGLTVINGKVSETSTDDNVASGAGIHVTTGIKGGTIQNCIVKNNRSFKRAGGGISLRGNFTVANCLIKDNVSANGSGGGIALYSSSGSSLKNSEILNNQGTDGGGVYVYSGTVENCIIEGNTGNNGGGLYMRTASAGYAYNCLIVNNQSTGIGGGVACQQANNATLYNCTIVNNVSKSDGGGLAYKVTPTAINIKNTILWGNKKGSVLDQIGANTGQKSDNSKMVYSGIQAETVTGTGNIALMQDSAVIWGSNWNLGAASPCVDAGTSEGISMTVDLAGQPRTIGAAIDMGVYERILYPGAGGVFYVNAAAEGNASGASWGDAFTEIQKGIDAALAYKTETGKEVTVWVAGGEYAVEAPVELKDGISIFGGFAGTEKKLEERESVSGGEAWEFVHPTVVKPAEGKAIQAMNARVAFTEKTYVNGFTITGGNAKGSGDDNRCGGGIHVMNNTFVQNCIITGNQAAGNGGGIAIRGVGISGIENCLIEKNKTAANGGGVALYATSTQVYIKNSKINDNNATGNGGGAFVYGGKVENCIVTNNSADKGGGIWSRQYIACLYTNCLVAYNHAKANSGAIWCEESNNAKFYNLTVVANTVDATGKNAAIGYNKTPTAIEIVNTIFYGNKKGETVDVLPANSKMTYSAVEAAVAPAGEKNMAITDSAAFFAENWHLAETSPGKNAGKNLSELPELDLDGALRVQNGTVDLGAYEAGILYSPDVNGVVYVKAGAGTDHVGNSWEEAVGDISFAIEIARLYNTKIGVGQKRAVVWVAGGEYALTESLGLVDGVSLYGGFAGTETTLEKRAKGGEAWEYTHVTVLKGSSGRSFNVLEQPGDFQVPTVIDGFTLQQGKTGANLAGNLTLQNCTVQNNGRLQATIGMEIGGGMTLKGNCIVEYCRVEGNTGKNGGGIAITGAGPVVRHCLVENNTANGEAAGLGGGIYNTKGRVESCTLKGNTAEQGGGIFVENDEAACYNCILEGNTAAYGGGLAYGETTEAVLYNLTVVNNQSSTDGGGVYFSKSGQSLGNTILWGNQKQGAAQQYAAAASAEPVIWYCAIQGEVETLPEGDNLALPAERGLIFDADAWSLCENSLCEDKGQNVQGLPETDFAGVKRTQGRTTDIGAYERPSDFYYHLSEAAILYVVAGQDGEGAAWDNAVGDLHLAMQLAAGYNDTVSLGQPKAQIWIAGGEYQLTKDLILADGVNIYGGFAGTETAIAERAKGEQAWEYTNATLLKGNEGRTFVVLNQNVDFKTSTIIDGVTAESGKSGASVMKNLTLQNCILRNNGATTDGLGTVDGGGITAKNACVIENCLVEGNTGKNGGGIAINGAGPIVRNCFVQGNTANGNGWGWGGGIFNNSGTVENCIVKNNTAEKGGGVFARMSASAFYNCIVEGNQASYGGGVTYEARNNDAKDAKIYHFTIVNNTATTAGGGVYFAKTGQTIINTIVWGNKLNGEAEEYAVADGITPVIRNCAILAEAAALPEGDNVALTAESEKIFADNWTLAENSPCIDKGQNVEGLPEKDVYGNRRTSAGVNDIGACEYQKVLDFVADENGIFYVKNVQVQGKGNSWESPIKDLATALKAAQVWQEEYQKVPQIWVAQGTYLLAASVNPVNGINIYGGFSGDKTETVEGREKGEKGSWDFVHETILDAVGVRQCLVQKADFSTVTIIDGLTLKSGLGLNGADPQKTPGGAALKQRAYLQNCKIINCKNGGVFFTSNSKMTGCYLSGNTSLNDGGAVNFEFGSIEDCVFENNSSEKDGGGASITYSGTAKNCIFRNNKAKNYGGGFKMHNGGTAINCLAEDNEAKNGGGFLFSGSATSVYAKPGTVINVTVVNNRATVKGGAFVAACMKPDVNLNIYNSIFWNNTVAGQQGNMTEPETPSTYTLENCLVMEGEVREGKDTDCLTYTTDQPKEQLFADDWALSITSPCVDAGKNDVSGSPEKDLAGNKRVSNGTVDLGVYEYQSLLDNFTIDYVQETIALKNSEAEVECSAQRDAWETVALSELIAKDKRVIYCRVAGGDISELLIPGRGEPTAKIDFASEKLVEVAENSSWNIESADVFAKIEQVELTPYIGTENREFMVKQPATTTAFKTEKVYTLPARIAAPAFTLNYVTEALEGTAGTDMTLYEASVGDAYTGLDAAAVITDLIPEVTDVSDFTLSVRRKATTENFASAVKEFHLNGRPAAPVYTIDFANEKTKEIIPATVEYDTVSGFATKAMGTGELLDLTPGKNYYFRVAASAERNSFVSVVFTLEVPQIPQMQDITLDYKSEKLAGLPPYAQWDYAGVTGEEAKEDISALISETEDVMLTVYVPVGEHTFKGEARQILLPKRPAAPDYVVDYEDEKIVTRDEGITPGNWEIKADGEFEVLNEDGNISRYVPAAGAEEAVITLRTTAGDGVFHSKEATITFAARPETPAFEVDYEQEKTTTAVASDIEYSVYEDMEEASLGSDALLALTPGVDLYFRYVAKENTFKSEKYHLVVPDRPSMTEVTIDYEAEVLNDLPAGTLWKIDEGEPQPAQADIRSIIPAVGTPDVNLTIWVPAGEQSFSSLEVSLTIPARPATPVVTVDYEKEELKGILSDMQWKRGESEVYEPAVTDIHGLIPAFGEAELSLSGIRVAASEANFKSGETAVVLKARQEKLAGYTIDYVEEKTVETIEPGIEYFISEEEQNIGKGNNERVTLQPGKNLVFRRAASNTEELFASEAFVLEVPGRPVIVIEDMEKELTDGSFTPKLWNSWNNTAQGIVLTSSDEQVAVVNKQSITLKAEGECEITAMMPANVDGLHFAAAPQTVRLKVGMGNVVADAELPNLKIAHGSMDMTFRIDKLGNVENARLVFFNRTGKVVFESNNYGNDFDMGRLDAGTYYYVLTYRVNGESKVKKGFVEIIR